MSLSCRSCGHPAVVHHGSTAWCAECSDCLLDPEAIAVARERAFRRREALDLEAVGEMRAIARTLLADDAAQEMTA